MTGSAPAESVAGPYAGRRVALLTQHGKERVIPRSGTQLEAARRKARIGEADNGRAFLETDVRAHKNPTRMEMIRLAAMDLAARLNSLCPACGAPTRETRAEVHDCLKCAHRLTRERADRQYADPGRCDYCNP